jgi:hypothetical protein
MFMNDKLFMRGFEVMYLGAVLAFFHWIGQLILVGGAFLCLVSVFIRKQAAEQPKRQLPRNQLVLIVGIEAMSIAILAGIYLLNWSLYVLVIVAALQIVTVVRIRKSSES